jgi:6-pyruvoyltetrahydropterin/6-carboxytetrahydropterin synthase
MFEIAVSQKFKAGHAIRTTSGEFEPNHMHEWKVDATVVGRDMDATGCVIDFAVVQRHLRSCISAWDGKNLNELGMFLDIPPSTEYLAKCLFDQLQATLQEDGVTLKKVTVWETENCSASFLGL